MRRIRICAGTRCAASGSRMPAIARTARSCRRRIQPARADDRPCAPDRSAGRRLGRGRVREPVPRAAPMTAHDPPALMVANHARPRRLRGGGLHAGPEARRSGDCRSGTSSCCSRSGPTATRELGARADVEYVFPFENRGVEVGVTLHHPHGQIYAYPFVPPVPARELEQQRALLRAARARPARRR